MKIKSAVKGIAFGWKHRSALKLVLMGLVAALMLLCFMAGMAIEHWNWKSDCDEMYRHKVGDSYYACSIIGD